mmetsp:Transcript_18751/g.52192  ORF Transcript_18751/g.52192 Transcript_18751/m.52192 type:complete len:509 (+) Transcript_18751:265-1791(+)|eukprot:CAMPEP_0117656746 /NCGR_PEP_ID=MMETSP0804-20121206/4967_1 /TAXON_ID=1074897 /ORGANISM="Tetraselmis astigmatica, Strain CCMP880" /LENGTH=508 /DNA_ID=CAMNT_0005463165 /DNA_START=234 /DNA_END=1760 /DNA_ORIENTATION=-
MSKPATQPVGAGQCEELRKKLLPASGQADKQHLRNLGLAMLYGRPPTYTPITTIPDSETIFCPRSSLEEALLCLLLSAEMEPKSLVTDPTLMWHLTLALSVAHHYAFLGNLLSQAFPSMSENPSAWEVKVQAQEAAGKRAEALQTVRNIVRFNDQAIMPKLQCARLSREMGKELDLEVSCARAALEKATGTGWKRAGHLALGLALEAQAGQCGGDYSDAIAEVSMALQLDPHDCKLNYHLARMKALAGYPPQEVASLAVNGLQAGGAVLGPLWAVLALARASEGDFEKAIKGLDAGLYESGPAHASLLLVTKIQVLLAADEPHQALETLQQLMAHVQRGTAHIESVDPVMRKVLEKEEARMWEQGVHVFLALEQAKDAEYCVDRTLALLPHQAESHHVQGLLQQAKGQADKALVSFQTAISINPRHSDSEIRCGALYRERGASGDLIIARDLLVSGLKHRPSSSSGWYNLGLVNRADNRLEEAEEDLRSAVLLQSNVLGLAYLLPRIV